MYCGGEKRPLYYTRTGAFAGNPIRPSERVEEKQVSASEGRTKDDSVIASV